MRERALGASIVLWTAIAWGGRIGLLVGGEDLWAWLRIGGSMLIGAAAAGSLLVPRMRAWRRPTLFLFSIWTVVLWSRSLIVNWVGSGSLAFKLVHTALAVGFFALALWAGYSAARGDAISGPDETDRREERQGESPGVSQG